MDDEPLYPPTSLRVPTPEDDVNPVNPFGLGLVDIYQSGWFRNGTDIVPGMTIGPDDVLLDCGCGIGRFGGFYAKTGAEIVLLDQNPESLAVAEQVCRSNGAERVQAFVGSCEPIPLPDASVTRVLCTEVLEHVDDPAVVVAEIARVAKPGALLLFTVPAPGHQQVHARVAPPDYFQRPNHVRIFARETFDHVVEASGLVIEQRSATGFFWSVFFAMYWRTGFHTGTTVHPALDHWTESWRALLDTPGGLDVKQALDEALPSSLVTLARKL